MDRDPRAIVENTAGSFALVGDDVDVGGAQGQCFGVVLHAGTASEIAEDHRGNSHEIAAAPRGA